MKYTVRRTGIGRAPYLVRVSTRRPLVEHFERFKSLRSADTQSGIRGQSMMLVAVLMSVLLVIPAALTAFAIAELGTANQSVIHDSALAAAEAGLSDYINSANGNSQFTGYNAAGTGSGQPGVSPAFGGNAGVGTWQQVTGSPDECYFYVPGAAVGQSVTLTVTGRSGPTGANCTSEAGKIYEYKTISAVIDQSLPTTDPYLYVNEYNVANPFVYGGYTGGTQSCAYYAYTQNSNWGFFFFGFAVWSDADDGTVNDGDWPSSGDWDQLGPSGIGLADGPGPYSYNGGVGGATGPSMSGTGFGSSGSTYIWPVIFTVDWPGAYGWAAPFGDDNSSWNSSYSQGGMNPTTDTAKSVNGPNGCGVFGAPYHDGYYTQSYSFNGNVSGSNPGANALMYSNDAYYVCPDYSSGPGFNYSSLTLQSGDPYTSGTAPGVPGGETSPTIINWNIFGFTILGFNASIMHVNGPPYYENGDTGAFTVTIFGFTIPSNAVQVCGTVSGSLSSAINEVSPQVHLPYTTPIGASATPDYTLSTVQNDATAGGCVYSGNVIFSFNSGGGANVNLNGGSVITGSGCTGGAVNPTDGIFFVENGDPQVSGSVSGDYTVAVASTAPSTQTLPGSPAFPYAVVGTESTSYIGNDTSAAGFNSFSDSNPDSIYITGDITYSGCPSASSTVALTTSNCSNYLGLLSQNNVVISYPTVTPGVEGAVDTDGVTSVNQNDLYDSENDSVYSCGFTDNNYQCSGDTYDGDGYWSCDYFWGCWNRSDPTDGDDNSGCWWGGCWSEGTDHDQSWTVSESDVNQDTDNDYVYGGSTGLAGTCTDADCDVTYVNDTPPGTSDGDGDDTYASTGVEMQDGSSGFVHTIDADIEAVWGSFMLDNYGYFSNADHSCNLAIFYGGFTNIQNEPSDDGTGNNGCVSDGDNDEGSVPGGGLVVNGAIAEFWRGILNHYEAYAGSQQIDGGYSTVTFNYDGRFQSNLPPDMTAPGGLSWQKSRVTNEPPICPTGATSGGTETTSACP